MLYVSLGASLPLWFKSNRIRAVNISSLVSRVIDCCMYSLIAVIICLLISFFPPAYGGILVNCHPFFEGVIFLFVMCLIVEV